MSHDYESGVSHVAVTLTGPGGRTVTGSARAQWFEKDNGDCGGSSGGDLYAPFCGVQVVLPQHAATGVWKLSGVTLTDNVGNTTIVTGLSGSPVSVTSNDVVSVRSFSATPNPVNNWLGSARTTVTLAVDGARGGVATVRGEFDYSRCQSFTATPTVNADGTVSVPVTMFQRSKDCTFSSLIVTDGAGNVAVYGATHGAPRTGLTIARMPNTTPPTLTGFTWSRQSFTRAESQNWWTSTFQLSATLSAPVAPVRGYDLSVILPDGSSHPISTGGIGGTHGGTLQFDGYPPSHLEPGTYPIGLRIHDESGLSSSYNLPWNERNTQITDGSMSITITP